MHDSIHSPSMGPHCSLQGVELSQLQIQRILFGCFPTFRDSPLEPGFDRCGKVA